MNYLPLLPLIIVVYVVTVDPNVSDYLYLKLVKSSILTLQTQFFRIKLLIQLKYELFLLRQKIVPKRFYDMAKEVRRKDKE